MKTKTISLKGKSQISIESIELPKLGKKDVLIKIEASALCGSEMSCYKGEGMGSGNLGHEAAGVVVEVGEEVSLVKVGGRIGVSAISGCGVCKYCQQKKYTWCKNRKFTCQAHSEYAIFPEMACHILPQDVPWDIGVLISGDGLGVPFHTSQKISRSGSDVIAVFGLGPIGLGNVLLQSFFGKKVIAIDLSEYRLNLAVKLGARLAIHAGSGKVKDGIKDLTVGEGADVCIEAAGHSETLKACFEHVRIDGTVIMNGEINQCELSPSEDFIRKDITAKGSWFYHFHEFEDMLRLFREGLEVSKMITHHFPLERADEAFLCMAQQRSGKIILMP